MNEFGTFHVGMTQYEIVQVILCREDGTCLKLSNCFSSGEMYVSGQGNGCSLINSMYGGGGGSVGIAF
jgi:hypothetical protein